MVRLFQIAFLSCVVTLLLGCEPPERSKPVWKHIKIGDLAPSHSSKRPAGQSLETMDFHIYISDIPAENIGALDDIWQMLRSPAAEGGEIVPLHTKPFRFNDYEAFNANSFLVGFGRVRMWNKITALLHAAGDKKRVESIKTVSLLLFDGQANDLAVARLHSEQTIFYTLTGGSMEGVTVGWGKLVLRIKAEKIPGSRGVCKVNVVPVFLPPRKSLIPQLAAREKSREFVFASAGFELKMSPGDIFFLGPEKYIDHQITLGSLFFSRPKPKQVVRTFLFACTRTID